MPTNEEHLLKRLLVTFKTEAREHIHTLASGLVELEKAPTGKGQFAILDTIFRSAHSLKGAARAVNVTEIERVCQSLESVFAALKRREFAPTPAMFDLLHQVVTALGQLLHSRETGPLVSPMPNATELVVSLETALTQLVPPAGGKSLRLPDPPSTAVLEVQQANPRENPVMTDTIRVSIAKLDSMLLRAEQLLSAKVGASQSAAGVRRLQSRSSEWKKNWAKLRIDKRRFQLALKHREGSSGLSSADSHFPPIAQFLEWNLEFMESLHAELTELAKAAEHNQRSVAAMVDDFLDEMRKVVMMPFSTLLDLFPPFVRELSREQGKEVDLIIRGGEVEIDRRILEEMKDPLIHFVRNCLDHGLETPGVRAERGKPPCGRIVIELSPINGSHVELLIADDGAGIDTANVKAAALKLGLLPPGKEEMLINKNALPFIFESGVSTSPIVSAISGRGLGLAIVKEKVQKLNGVLSVETDWGAGTSFRIILPLTLSRFHGLVVRVQKHLFIVPTRNVERVTRVRKGEIKTVENRETIVFNGKTLSLARLDNALGLPANANAAATNQSEVFLPVAVLTSGNQRIAFLVDEILDQQEVLVKSLGKQLARVRNIAGATIMGSNKIVLILNVADLIKSAVRASATAAARPARPAKTAEIKKKRVLVAEDSITSRDLLKNILEGSGYQVETAIDGIDAFTKLRSGNFDLIVSDVEMPRMNGFGLTAKIRADNKFADFPVVLVTSADSRADREQGIDVGANAYIAKSSFDQSNLLEVIRRLI
jgi:two-component system, chemotaxis family, sensor kinase CheA